MTDKRYTEQLGDLLRAAFEPPRGPDVPLVEPITFQGIARDVTGFGRVQINLTVARHDPLVASHLLKLIRDGYELRIEPFGRLGHKLAVLPALFVMWKPETTLVSYRHQVTNAGVDRVRTALARMPRPTAFVDAAHEVWAAWALVEPIADMRAATALLREGAERLGGVDIVPTGVSEVPSLPCAGNIRNWNNDAPDWVHVVETDHTRRFVLHDLQAAMRESTDVGQSEGHACRLEQRDEVADGERSLPAR